MRSISVFLSNNIIHYDSDQSHEVTMSLVHLPRCSLLASLLIDNIRNHSAGRSSISPSIIYHQQSRMFLILIVRTHESFPHIFSLFPIPSILFPQDCLSSRLLECSCRHLRSEFLGHETYHYKTIPHTFHLQNNTFLCRFSTHC